MTDVRSVGMDMDRERAADAGQTGPERPGTAEEPRRRPKGEAGEAGAGAPPRCPDDYCFEIGM